MVANSTVKSLTRELLQRGSQCQRGRYTTASLVNGNHSFTATDTVSGVTSVASGAQNVAVDTVALGLRSSAPNKIVNTEPGDADGHGGSQQQSGRVQWRNAARDDEAVRSTAMEPTRGVLTVGSSS